MSQHNSPIDPADDIPMASAASGQNAATPAGKPIKRKRRWITRILLVFGLLIIGLAALVAIVPTLLSTATGRNYVVGKINQNINGRVEVKEWSVGWRGGIHAQDVKVFDQADRQIMQVPRFSTEFSFLDALRGNIHLGNTVIEGLDFFAERDAEGALNFQKLLRVPPGAATAVANNSVASNSSGQPPATAHKLPSIDGEIHLINCRGTFVDEQRGATLNFSTISGDIKIPSINSTIENSLKVVANVPGSNEFANVTVKGKIQLAKDNFLLPLTEITVDEAVVLNVDPKTAQEALGPFLGLDKDHPVFPDGKVALNVKLTSDGKAAALVVNATAPGMKYVSAGGTVHSIGDLQMSSQIGATLAPSTAPAGLHPSLLDGVSAIQITDFSISGVGSSVKLKGSVDDPGHACKFANVTADLNYDAAKLWKDLIFPLLPKETQESLKDTKVDGIHKKTFTFGGNLPTDKEFSQAIVGLLANGELEFDRVDVKGAAITNLILPLTLEAGHVRIAYPKGAPKEFADAANLNGGKFSLAGANLDLTDPHLALAFPDNTLLLDNVAINPTFASYWLGDCLANPLFVKSDHAAGQFSATIRQCKKLPIDYTIARDVAFNQGVMELNLKIARFELKSPYLIDLANTFPEQKTALLNLKGKVDRFQAIIEHGSVRNHLAVEDIAGSQLFDLTTETQLETGNAKIRRVVSRRMTRD